jgi:hypothetical protein
MWELGLSFKGLLIAKRYLQCITPTGVKASLGEPLFYNLVSLPGFFESRGDDRVIEKNGIIAR